MGPSKDLPVSTFSLEAGDSTSAAAAAQVVEVEPSEDLAKPGPLNYLVEVDPLEDLTTSTDYGKSGKVRDRKKQQTINKDYIDAVLYLARQGLAFRGHREYQGLDCASTNKGISDEVVD